MGIWFDEFVAKPIIFLYPIYYFIVNVEKKRFFEGISLRSTGYMRDVLYGIGVGSLFLVTSFATSTFIIRGLDAYIGLFALAFVSSFSEEALSRGFILNRIYNEHRNKILSALAASILFFIIRIPILMTDPNLMGINLIQIMVMNMLLSIIISLLFLLRRSLLFAVMIHTMYILSLYYFGAM
jgi:membrane protease YdiL (CAAX protease family)